MPFHIRVSWRVIVISVLVAIITIAGSVAGLVLVQQNQDTRQKAAGNGCCGAWDCTSDEYCSGANCTYNGGPLNGNSPNGGWGVCVVGGNAVRTDEQKAAEIQQQGYTGEAATSAQNNLAPVTPQLTDEQKAAAQQRRASTGATSDASGKTVQIPPGSASDCSFCGGAGEGACDAQPVTKDGRTFTCTFGCTDNLKFCTNTGSCLTTCSDPSYESVGPQSSNPTAYATAVAEKQAGITDTPSSTALASVNKNPKTCPEGSWCAGCGGFCGTDAAGKWNDGKTCYQQQELLCPNDVASQPCWVKGTCKVCNPAKQTGCGKGYLCTEPANGVGNPQCQLIAQATPTSATTRNCTPLPSTQCNGGGCEWISCQNVNTPVSGCFNLGTDHCNVCPKDASCKGFVSTATYCSAQSGAKDAVFGGHQCISNSYTEIDWKCEADGRFSQTDCKESGCDVNGCIYSGATGGNDDTQGKLAQDTTTEGNVGHGKVVAQIAPQVGTCSYGVSCFSLGKEQLPDIACAPSCQSGGYCCGTSITQVCSPSDTPTCNGVTAVKVCKADGSGYTTTACIAGTQCTNGRCSAPTQPTVQAGGSCSKPTDCATGFSCVGAEVEHGVPGSGTCQKLSTNARPSETPLGGSCLSNDECVTGLDCVGTLYERGEQTPGVCGKPPVAVPPGCTRQCIPNSSNQFEIADVCDGGKQNIFRGESCSGDILAYNAFVKQNDLGSQLSADAAFIFGHGGSSSQDVVARAWAATDLLTFGSLTNDGQVNAEGNAQGTSILDPDRLSAAARLGTTVVAEVGGGALALTAATTAIPVSTVVLPAIDSLSTAAYAYGTYYAAQASAYVGTTITAAAGGTGVTAVLAQGALNATEWASTPTGQNTIDTVGRYATTALNVTGVVGTMSECSKDPSSFTCATGIVGGQLGFFNDLDQQLVQVKNDAVSLTTNTASEFETASTALSSVAEAVDNGVSTANARNLQVPVQDPFFTSPRIPTQAPVPTANYGRLVGEGSFGQTYVDDETGTLTKVFTADGSWNNTGNIAQTNFYQQYDGSIPNVTYRGTVPNGFQQEFIPNAVPLGDFVDNGGTFTQAEIDQAVSDLSTAHAISGQAHGDLVRPNSYLIEPSQRGRYANYGNIHPENTLVQTSADGTHAIIPIDYSGYLDLSMDGISDPAFMQLELDTFQQGLTKFLIK